MFYCMFYFTSDRSFTAAEARMNARTTTDREINTSDGPTQHDPLRFADACCNPAPKHSFI